jgi:hypothetical protein
MRKARQFLITIKDAKGSLILATSALWDGDDQRIAVAKILHLDGVVEAPLSPIRSPGRELAMNLEAASFAISTPAKKKPRH